MRRVVAIAGAAVVALAACSSSDGSSAEIGSPTGPSPTASSPAAPSPSAPASSPTPAVTGPCANDYFPVVAGATWTYRRTVAQTTAQARQTFGAIGDTGFTVLLSSPQGGERDVWACSRAGLADTDQHVTGPGGGPPPPGTVVFHHFVSSGVTVPASLHVGSAWTQVVTSHARFTIMGVGYPETQVVTTRSRVVGEGSVTTPAGVFHALKVQVSTSIHKTATSLGMDTTAVTRGTQWLVRGVGIVASVTTNSSSFTSKVVLIAYRIP